MFCNLIFDISVFLIQNSDLVTIEEQVLKLISVTLPRSSAKNTD